MIYYDSLAQQERKGEGGGGETEKDSMSLRQQNYAASIFQRTRTLFWILRGSRNLRVLSEQEISLSWPKALCCGQEARIKDNKMKR